MHGHRLKKLRSNQTDDILIESGFVCAHCGRPVTPDPSGTGHRNHCPACLHSLHLDILPGDRAANCGGIMEPVAVTVRKNGEWSLIHRCKVCGVLKENRIAGDDNSIALISLAVRPVARPPFPLEGLLENNPGELKGESQ